MNINYGGIKQETVFFYVISILHSSKYLAENAAVLRQDWPRIPLPASKDGLLASAELGRALAALLDPESPAPGVNAGDIRPELKPIATLSRDGGGALDRNAGHLALTAGWGHAGQNGVTMPGRGRVKERPYTPDELAAIAQGAATLGLSAEQALDLLGPMTLDVYLNDVAYWRNVPKNVWAYTIGGYQVLKKWLSYRERPLLGRDLWPDEARYLVEVARRIAAIILMTPALDANYQAVKANTYPWPGL